ncbi:MAG TPA: protein-glutamate O-methyltransferase CheR, partial [Vicinamibacteria bacterium]
GRRPRRVRVWSAACSTGEEPYSIAMTLLAGLPGWSVEVVATDLSTKVLARAQAALWPVERAKQIPRTYLEAYMLKGFGSQAGLMKAGEALRGVVRFGRVNLAGEPWPEGPFDLVFCRNVLIYFDRTNKTRVVERLLDRLAPEGFLFLGHAESLTGFTEGARTVIATIYQRAVPRTGR